MDRKKHIIVGHSGVFQTEFDVQAKAKPIKMKDGENDQGSGTKWARYFADDDNTFPTKLLEKMEMLSLGKRAVTFNGDAHYGAGVEWFQKKSEGNKIIKYPVIIPDWDEWKLKTDFDQVLSDLIDSLEMFYWAPVRFLLTKDRKSIYEMEVLDPVYTRIEKRDLKTGKISKVFFSYLFPNNPLEHEIVEYPLYDPEKEQTEFVVLFSYRSFGRIYYPIPDYYAVFQNGWVDVAISVPEFIKTMYDHSANIKYHVQIPQHYFAIKYKDWAEKTEEDQIKIFDTERKEMDDYLHGKKNAHKTFVSVFGLDDDGKKIEGWVIEPIQDYIKKDAELPNNAAANSEIAFAFGVDPSLVGHGIPGGKDLSGSGSDKRTAMNLKQALLFRERLVSLRFPKFCAMLNNIDTKGAVPMYIDIDASQTLDKNPTGKETKVNG